MTFLPGVLAWNGVEALRGTRRRRLDSYSAYSADHVPRQEVRGEAEALRRGSGELEWLFPNEEGHPLDESRVRKVFRRGLAQAKLPGFRVYDLHHTYASLLLAAGAPITYVSTQLGHATPTTTLRYYAKWIRVRGGGGWRCSTVEPNGISDRGRRASDRKKW
jgi:integrase